MKVRFEFTLDDLVDVVERASGRSRVVRSIRWQGLVISVAMSGLVVYAMTSGPTDQRLTWGIGGALCAAVFFVLVDTRTRKTRLRRYFREQFGGAGPFTCEVELTPGGLVTNQAGTESRRTWSTVVGVEDTADGIEFVTRGAGTLIVRDRAFASPQERQRFLDLARGYAGRPTPT
jgi:YcxB-like protein